MYRVLKTKEERGRRGDEGLSVIREEDRRGWGVSVLRRSSKLRASPRVIDASYVDFNPNRQIRQQGGERFLSSGYPLRARDEKAAIEKERERERERERPSYLCDPSEVSQAVLYFVMHLRHLREWHRQGNVRQGKARGGRARKNRNRKAVNSRYRTRDSININERPSSSCGPVFS